MRENQAEKASDLLRAHGVRPSHQRVQVLAHLLAPRPAWPDNPTWQNIVAVQWQALPRRFDLAVVNLASHRCQCYVPLVVPQLERYNWRMRDLLGTEDYERVGDDLHNQGLYLDAPPHAAQLFHFAPA